MKRLLIFIGLFLLSLTFYNVTECKSIEQKAKDAISNNNFKAVQYFVEKGNFRSEQLKDFLDLSAKNLKTSKNIPKGTV